MIGYSAFLMLVTGCNGNGGAGNTGRLMEPLRPYVSQVLNEFDSISTERKETLDQISEMISGCLEHNQDANLTFICSHNSRRSHMSQVWSQTAAYYYGVDRVFTFSGGTEATACNVRTVSALQRAGFSIMDEKGVAWEGPGKNPGDHDEDHGGPGDGNPVYLIRYAENRPPMKAYSKLYNEGDNPREDYIALMCCSKADMQCPVVDGASSRFAIHYSDPGECDDTDEETAVYDERCREIAREMFYIMSHVGQTKSKS